MEEEVHFEYDDRSFHGLNNFFVVSWRKNTKLYSARDFIFESECGHSLVIIQGYMWDAGRIDVPLTARAIYQKIISCFYDIECVK
ncbi:MAG: hypothetical protein R3E89_00555, partial [Thiolinea sp.]